MPAHVGDHQPISTHFLRHASEMILSSNGENLTNFDMVGTELGETDRLTLESLTVAHADELAGLLDPRVNAHFVPNDTPVSIADLRARFAQMIAGPGEHRPGERWLNFAVRLAMAGTCIGRLEVTLQDEDAEVAFLFVPEAWGRGYATEAMVWLHDFCFRHQSARRFWATVSPANLHSLALCRRLGYSPAPPAMWPKLTSYDDGDTVLVLSADAWTTMTLTTFSTICAATRRATGPSPT